MDASELVGMDVKVHFNLTKWCWSVTARKGEMAGRVIANVDDITLMGMRFHVNPNKNESLRNGGKRTVHAWGIGRVAEVNTSPDLEVLTCVSYNPRDRGDRTFKIRDARSPDNGKPIEQADRMVFAKLDPADKHGYAWI
ncbi:hypothetical protein [Actinomadura atramentaria]|uniref:hypothetical protein n=1 Tax=Actinomadura atramentaria TaxID=1990 RepID=UPI000477D5F8|nr:hypothetical protein [Actinomadura atramentaria]